MSLALLRAPLTLFSSFNISYTFTNPNPSVSREESNKYNALETKFGRYFLIWPASLKVAFCTAGLCEAAIVLAQHAPSYPLSQWTLGALTRHGGAVSLSPAFLLGTAMTALGTYIRWRCYRTLGRFFTFQLAIRKGHRLVKDGPYGWVRHPSYTSGLLALFGAQVIFLGRGSWLRECGVLETWTGKAIASAVAVNFLLMSAFVLRRSVTEDGTLRAEFGKEWEKWAEKVPYRIIPYIF